MPKEITGTENWIDLSRRDSARWLGDVRRNLGTDRTSTYPETAGNGAPVPWNDPRDEPGRDMGQRMQEHRN